MKNTTLNNLTVVFAVTALLVSGSRAFAEYIPLIDYDAYYGGYVSDHSNVALYRTFNSMFGTNYGSNTDLAVDRLTSAQFSGTFEAYEIRVFLLSAVPGRLWPPVSYDFPSRLTIFGDSPSVNYGVSNYIIDRVDPPTQTSRDFLNREIFAYTSPTPDDLPFNFMIQNDDAYLGATYFSNPDRFENVVPFDPRYPHNYIYFDVTALMQANYGYLGFEFGAAYLVAYEDFHASNWAYDGDFNDAVFLVFTSEYVPPPAPEPATLILWSIGGVGLIGTTWLRKRNMKRSQLAS